MVFEYDSTEEVVNKLKSMLKTDDIVLVKASNGMHFNTIVQEIE
jgi:UDP-N-acetylmuramyl pentapeptide synthase